VEERRGEGVREGERGKQAHRRGPNDVDVVWVPGMFFLLFFFVLSTNDQIF
jgi:hypothetical protein